MSTILSRDNDVLILCQSLSLQCATKLKTESVLYKDFFFFHPKKAIVVTPQATTHLEQP
eukprot:m.224104 g.224104  ORF g.224104 m.224104 type:complete len:59 (-) comp17030_c1_seq1:73-249(-)